MRHPITIPHILTMRPMFIPTSVTDLALAITDIRIIGAILIAATMATAIVVVTATMEAIGAVMVTAIAEATPVLAVSRALAADSLVGAEALAAADSRFIGPKLAKSLLMF